THLTALDTSRHNVIRAFTLDLLDSSTRLHVSFFFLMPPPPPRSPLFPYTTLFRSVGTAEWTGTPLAPLLEEAGLADDAREMVFTDRKSTRLNSSHRTISYAVFCLKKKKKTLSEPIKHQEEVASADELATPFRTESS